MSEKNFSAEDIDSVKETRYQGGITLPNGRTIWSSGNNPIFALGQINFDMLHTKKEQDKAQVAYRDAVKNMGVIVEEFGTRLKFVRRLEMLAYSAAEDLTHAS